jgi:hypothetical protein
MSAIQQQHIGMILGALLVIVAIIVILLVLDSGQPPPPTVTPVSPVETPTFPPSPNGTPTFVAVTPVLTILPPR